MQLEPVVLERISEERRRRSRQRFVFILPVLASVLGIVIAIGAVFYARSYAPKSMQNVGVYVFLASFYFVFMLVLYTVGPIRVREKPQFLEAFAKPEPGDSVGGFGSALENVSSRLGVTPPEMMLLALPRTGTASVKLSGKDYVAVAKEVLSAGFSLEEREALMAHELAHIQLDQAVRRPAFWRLDKLTMLSWEIGGVFALDAVFALLLVGIVGKTHQAPAYAAAAAIVVLSVVVPILIWRLLRNRLTMMSGHDDILADSIACKITSDPEALARSLKKLRSLGLLSYVSIFTYTSVFGWGDDFSMMEDVPRGVYLTAVPCELDERLVNLKEIETGHWQVFDEVKDARLLPEAGGWE